MVVRCNVESCIHNRDGRCMADPVLRCVYPPDWDWEHRFAPEFEDQILDLELGPATVQVERAMMVCMSYSPKPHKPAIRGTLVCVLACPRCGSENVEKASGECPSGYTSVRCRDCGHEWCTDWWRDEP